MKTKLNWEKAGFACWFTEANDCEYEVSGVARAHYVIYRHVGATRKQIGTAGDWAQIETIILNDK